MHNLYKLTCEELEKLDRKAMNSDLSPTEFKRMSDLIGAKKDMLKIGEMEDTGSSFARGGNRGGSYGSYNIDSYDGGYDDISYARSDGRGRGRNARRDSMGRYSRDDGMIADLRELMEDAPDEKTRMEFQRFIQKIEKM